MAAQPFVSSEATQAAGLNGSFCKVYHIPYGMTKGDGTARFSGRNGFYLGATPTVAQGAVELCTLSELGDIGIAIENETTVTLPGKKSYTTGGRKSLNFELRVQGNAMGTLEFLMGISPHTNEAINGARYDFGYVGALIIDRYSSSGKRLPVQSTLIPNVKMKIDSWVGFSNGTDGFQTVKFYQEEAEYYTVTGTQLWDYSLFVNTGSIANADAPDGTKTAFVLDNCNNSATATPPVPVMFNPEATGWGQYLAILRNDGRVPDANASAVVTSATFSGSTITFGAAPAVGSSILAVYAIDLETHDSPMRHGNNGMYTLVEKYMGVLPA